MSDLGLDSPRDGAEKKSVQICEDPNSKAHLEALFNVLNTGNSQESWSGRKLPDSFFSDPSTKEKPGIRRLGPSISVGPSSGPSIQHNRSVSMPASISEAHPRQFSLDSAAQGPIPPGWEMARTPDGLTYYIDHNTMTTTWEDPRKLMSRMGQGSVQPTHHLGPMPPYPQQPPHPVTHQTHQQNTAHNQSVDSLPPGWQKAYTAEGEPYYVNHKNRTTSWFHPSCPQHHHSHSYAGMSRGVPRGYQNYSPQQSMTLQQHLQVDKDARRLPFDSHQDTLMQQQNIAEAATHVPATLYNDPYLSSNNHIRQASHDSGLGVTALPYQTDAGMEFDDSMDTGPSLKASQNQEYLDPEHQIPEQMEGELLPGRWV